MSADSEFHLLHETKWNSSRSLQVNFPLDVVWDSVNETWRNGTLFGADGTALAPITQNATALPDYFYIYLTTTIFYGVVFLFGVVGNVLVIYVVLRNSDMLTATNLFLMNLSIADLLVLLICMPSALIEFLARDVWLLGAAMCKLVAYLEIAVTHTSILTILAISFERYYAICCPLEVLYTCTKRRAFKILLGIWFVGVVSAIPIMIMTFTEQTDFHSGGLVTVCRSHINDPLKKCYIVAILILFFAVPFVFLVVLYTFICRQLLKDETGMAGKMRNRQRFTHMEQQNNGEAYARATSKQRKRTLNSRKQVIYMLITIIALFFICLLPVKVVSTWLVFSSADDVISIGLEAYLNLLSFSRIMFYINSAVNPVLYNIVSTKFRDACRRSIGCTPESERRRRNRSFMFYSSSSQRRVTTKTTVNFDHDFEDPSSHCRHNSVAYSVTATGDTTASLLHTDLNSIVKSKGETFI